MILIIEWVIGLILCAYAVSTIALVITFLGLFFGLNALRGAGFVKQLNKMKSDENPDDHEVLRTAIIIYLFTCKTAKFWWVVSVLVIGFTLAGSVVVSFFRG